MPYLLFKNGPHYEESTLAFVFCPEGLEEEVTQKVRQWLESYEQHQAFKNNLSLQVCSQFNYPAETLPEAPKKPKGPEKMTRELALAYEPLRRRWNVEMDAWNEEWVKLNQQRNSLIEVEFAKQLKEHQALGTPNSQTPPELADWLEMHFQKKVLLIEYETRFIDE